MLSQVVKDSYPSIDKSRIDPTSFLPTYRTNLLRANSLARRRGETSRATASGLRPGGSGRGTRRRRSSREPGRRRPTELPSPWRSTPGSCERCEGLGLAEKKETARRWRLFANVVKKCIECRGYCSCVLTSAKDGRRSTAMSLSLRTPRTLGRRSPSKGGGRHSPETGEGDTQLAERVAGLGAQGSERAGRDREAGG